MKSDLDQNEAMPTEEALQSGQDGMDNMKGMEEMDDMKEMDENEGNLVYLPEGIFEGAKDGDPVKGEIEGKIVEQDGKLYVKVETLDGESVEEKTKEPTPENMAKDTQDARGKIESMLKERVQEPYGQ